MECWQHIIDFHSFRQWILSAQAQQEEDLKFIKQEDQTDEQMAISYNINIYDTNPDTYKTTDEDNKMENSENDDFITKINGRFKCHKCKELFSSYVTLEAHLKKFHSNEQSNFHSRKIENPFVCDTCGASFTLNGNLKRHIKRSHKVQPVYKWICKYCNKMFKTRFHLESHKRKSHSSQLKNDLEFDLSGNTKKSEEKYLHEFETYDSESEDIKLDSTCENSHHESSDSESSLLKTEPPSKMIRRQITVNNPFLCGSTNSNTASTSTQIKTSNLQINEPTLDIMDVKTEISSDVEIEIEGNKFVSENIKTVSATTVIEEETQDDYIKKWKGDLECPKCSQFLSNFSKLNEHFTTEHPEERCYINCCQRTLYNPTDIIEHLQIHENLNAFKCDDCGKRFNNSRGLSSHKLQVHTNKRSIYHLHVCYCKRSIELQAENKAKGIQMTYDDVVCCHRKKKILEDDALIAEWKKELNCEICNATFPFYSLMRAHYYNEHPTEKCYISCCQRKMSRVSDALEHIRFHLDPHAYRCKICNIIFSAKNTLAKHMRNSHSDSMPKHQWACDECDKSFEIRQILTRHKNVYHCK